MAEMRRGHSPPPSNKPWPPSPFVIPPYHSYTPPIMTYGPLPQVPLLGRGVYCPGTLVSHTSSYVGTSYPVHRRDYLHQQSCLVGTSTAVSERYLRALTSPPRHECHRVSGVHLGTSSLCPSTPPSESATRSRTADPAAFAFRADQQTTVGHRGQAEPVPPAESSRLTRTIQHFLQKSDHSLDRYEKVLRSRSGASDLDPHLSVPRSTAKSARADSIAARAERHRRSGAVAASKGAAHPSSAPRRPVESCSSSSSSSSEDSLDDLDSDDFVDVLGDKIDLSHDTSAEISKLSVLDTGSCSWNNSLFDPSQLDDLSSGSDDEYFDVQPGGKFPEQPVCELHASSSLTSAFAQTKSQSPPVVASFSVKKSASKLCASPLRITDIKSTQGELTTNVSSPHQVEGAGLCKLFHPPVKKYPAPQPPGSRRESGDRLEKENVSKHHSSSVELNENREKIQPRVKVFRVPSVKKYPAPQPPGCSPAPSVYSGRSDSERGSSQSLTSKQSASVVSSKDSIQSTSRKTSSSCTPLSDGFPKVPRDERKPIPFTDVQSLIRRSMEIIAEVAAAHLPELKINWVARSGGRDALSPSPVKEVDEKSYNVDLSQTDVNVEVPVNCEGKGKKALSSREVTLQGDETVKSHNTNSKLTLGDDRSLEEEKSHKAKEAADAQSSHNLFGPKTVAADSFCVKETKVNKQETGDMKENKCTMSSELQDASTDVKYERIPENSARTTDACDVESDAACKCGKNTDACINDHSLLSETGKGSVRGHGPLTPVPVAASAGIPCNSSADEGLLSTNENPLPDDSDDRTCRSAVIIVTCVDADGTSHQNSKTNKVHGDVDAEDGLGSSSASERLLQGSGNSVSTDGSPELPSCDTEKTKIQAASTSESGNTPVDTDTVCSESTVAEPNCPVNVISGTSGSVDSKELKEDQKLKRDRVCREGSTVNTLDDRSSRASSVSSRGCTPDPLGKSVPRKSHHGKLAAIANVFETEEKSKENEKKSFKVPAGPKIRKLSPSKIGGLASKFESAAPSSVLSAKGETPPESRVSNVLGKLQSPYSKPFSPESIPPEDKLKKNIAGINICNKFGPIGRPPKDFRLLKKSKTFPARQNVDTEETRKQRTSLQSDSNGTGVANGYVPGLSPKLHDIIEGEGLKQHCGDDGREDTQKAVVSQGGVRDDRSTGNAAVRASEKGNEERTECPDATERSVYTESITMESARTPLDSELELVSPSAERKSVPESHEGKDADTHIEDRKPAEHLANSVITAEANSVITAEANSVITAEANSVITAEANSAITAEACDEDAVKCERHKNSHTETAGIHLSTSAINEAVLVGSVKNEVTVIASLLPLHGKNAECSTGNENQVSGEALAETVDTDLAGTSKDMTSVVGTEAACEVTEAELMLGRSSIENKNKDQSEASLTVGPGDSSASSIVVVHGQAEAAATVCGTASSESVSIVYTQRSNPIQSLKDLCTAVLQEEIFVDAVEPSRMDTLMPLPQKEELCFMDRQSRCSTPLEQGDRSRSLTPSRFIVETDQILSETDRLLRKSRSRSSLRQSFSRSLSGLTLHRLAEVSSELSEEQTTAHLAAERLEGEQAERMRLEKEVAQLQAEVKKMTSVNNRLEMERHALRTEVFQRSEVNGDLNEYDEEGDASLYKRKYEWSLREAELLKKQLKQQQEDDLDQLLLLKKQLEKKAADAYEETDEQRQVVAQLKKKSQRLQSEMNDMKILLEEQTARNNLLEKRQRKFDQDIQGVQEECRAERLAKDRLQRERDTVLAEKYSYEQEVATLKLELELKEEKISTLQKELQDLSFTGKAEEEVAVLKRAKHDLEVRIKDQEEELDDLAGQVQMLEAARVRLEMTIEQMRKENRKESQQKDEEVEEVRISALKKVKALETQLEAEHEERTQLVREKHELERRLVDARERTVSSLDEDYVHRLKKELKKTKALLKDTQTMLDKAHSEGSNKLLLRQLKTQLEDAEFAKTAALKARQSAEADLAEVQSQLDEVLRMKKEAEDRCLRVVKEKTELQAQLEESEEEVAEVMKKYKATVAQLSVDQVTLSEQSAQIAELEHDRQILQERLAELSSKVEVLEGESANIHTQRRLQMKIKELESKLDLEQTTRQRIECQVNRLKDQVEKLGVECDSARLKEAQASDQGKKLNRQLRDTKEDFSTLQQKYTEAVSKKQELEKQLELADSEIATLKSDLKLAFKRIEDLQQALQGDLSDSDSEVSGSDSDTDASLTSYLTASMKHIRSSSNSTLRTPPSEPLAESRIVSPASEGMSVISEDAECTRSNEESYA